MAAVVVEQHNEHAAAVDVAVVAAVADVAVVVVVDDVEEVVKA